MMARQRQQWIPWPCADRLGRGGFLALAILACVSAAGRAEDANDANRGARPVPDWQIVPLPLGQAAVERQGREISRYYFGESLRRPFLYPMIGPAGRSVTRMGHPHDPNGHSHHNSVWISHHDVAGVDFWGDAGKGRIVHRRVMKYQDGPDECQIVVENGWLGAENEVLLVEERRMRFAARAGGEWMLDLAMTLKPSQTPVTLGKTPFGLVGVRMAKTIGVHDGGGRIRNSEGGENEAGVFWKRARWVDYAGPMTSEVSEGITLLDHPQNPRHPAYFHVRDDGWMGASLTHEQPLTIDMDKPLTVRYGLYVHSGLPSAAKLDQVFSEFSQSPSSIER